jgi:DNA-binding XRE family transcriptional regulator
MAISSAQCRAARALLDMDQSVLAEAAHVSRNLIVAFERERHEPGHNNLAAIQRALEEAGVEFTNGNAPGVRLKKSKK